MNNKLLRTHKSVISNNDTNIKVYLVTEYYLNEKTGEIYTKQKVSLDIKENSEFSLYNIDLTPDKLIELAKQLSIEEKEVENITFN